MVDTVTNPLELSDEDFAKLPMPGDEVSEAVVEAPVQAGAEGVSEAEANQNNQQGAAAGEEEEGDEGTGAEAQGAEGEGNGGGDAAGAEGAEGGAAQPKAEEQQGKEGAEAPKPEGTVPPAGSKPEGQEGQQEPAAGTTGTVVRTAETDKAFYDKVMAPLTGGGKGFTPLNADEVIKLMHQGVNYTQKMQAIAPHRKMLTMAQNNGITEDKLSFLIDLDKGDPAAIQKFLKDKAVDPLSIDIESEPTYREGTHKVSDAEVAFNANLEELSSTPEGKETLQTINSTWDDASKEVLWGEPTLMTAIHAQRANGVYDLITTEMNRRRVLGTITPETSFIDAYRMVGDDLMKQAEAAGKTAAPAPVVTPPAPVATTAAAPKPTVENGDKASAASPTRSTPKPAKVNFNPLAMSDEEFQAQFAKMQGRV